MIGLILLGIFLAIIGFTVGGICLGIALESERTSKKNNNVLLGVFLLFVGIFGFILQDINNIEITKQYYKERIPTLEQQLKDYEIQQLEKQIGELENDK